jgi:hypothetical protein
LFTEEDLSEAIQLLRLGLEEANMAATVKKRVVQRLVLSLDLFIFDLKPLTYAMFKQCSVNDSFVTLKTLYSTGKEKDEQWDSEVKRAMAQRDTLVSKILLRLADFEKTKKELTELQLGNQSMFILRKCITCDIKLIRINPLFLRTTKKNRVAFR